MRERLLLLSRIEGLSLLALMLVAMPLKYAAGIPEPVQVVGWIHGLLFIVFIAAVVWTWWQRAIDLVEACWAAVTSVLPFGFLLLERRMRARPAAPAAAGA